MDKTTTKLLVIVITTAAILAMATTTSLSAATPAFAKMNCTDNPDGTTVCNGGSSLKSRGICETFPTCRGGSGQHQVLGEQTTISGGGGGNNDFNTGGIRVGGSGGHVTCDNVTPCNDPTNISGGSGLHFKGPGGNSVNAPP
jgi:hypothetical protein